MSFGSGNAKYVVAFEFIGSTTTGNSHLAHVTQLQYNNGGVSFDNQNASSAGTLTLVDNDYITLQATNNYPSAGTVTVTAKHDCTVFTSLSLIPTEMSAGDTETFTMGDIRNDQGLAVVFYD